MQKIRVSDINQYYSNQGKPDSHNQFTELWMVDIQENNLNVAGEVLGISQELIYQAEKLSEGWCGWGFYTHCQGESVYSNLPVLLFERCEDAIFARLHWTPSDWLSKPD